MSGRTNSRPAARPPAKPELTLAEIASCSRPRRGSRGGTQEARVIWAFAWAVCRPPAAGFAIIDVAATLAAAHALARRHPGAVAMFRSLRLVRIVEDF